MDPIVLATGLIPLLSSVVNKLINKFTGSPDPQTVDEVIRLHESEVARLEALAKLDKEENVSRSVANIRALQRPVAVILILMTWIGVMSGLLIVSPNVIQIVADLSGAVIFYLFGERTLMYAQRRQNR